MVTLQVNLICILVFTKQANVNLGAWKWSCIQVHYVSNMSDIVCVIRILQYNIISRTYIPVGYVL